ncbi:glycosyltransferase family 4 protein [Niabella beijingensis]|uniref:glycosyltransferase family 4 protein n=1 Tax=Niabella beijingensis TaxID=2872700 RepID=UPI001CBAF75E|nr:glycosyltransferase family 4 protein [Niabella beijingensis]MBZ4188245.1 glycosyltransferase family 4 protein [Niabella beijingensis]
MNIQTKPNVAVITFLCPFPVSDGGRFGVFGQINDLRKFYNVTLVFKVAITEKPHVEALQAMWPEVEILPVYSNDVMANHASKKQISFLKKISRLVKKVKKRKKARRSHHQGISNPHRHYPFLPVDRQMIDFLEALFQKQTFDIVQVEYSDLLPLIHSLPHGAKTVFFQHENRYLILQDYFKLYNDKSLYASHVIDTVKFTELNLMNLYDRVLVLNQNDFAQLQEGVHEAKLRVWPTAVPDMFYAASVNRQPPEKAEKIVFLGSQGHPPNEDALKWFIEGMYPAVLKQTGMLLYVTGVWEESFKNNYPEVIFTGFLQDLTDLLHGAVLISPIRLGGGGIRIKILQSMAVGVPVITTLLACDGMEGIKHGENIFVAEQEAGFIEILQDLAAKEGLYASVSEHAKKFIQDHYSEGVTSLIRQKVYNELLAETPGHRSDQGK